MRRVKMLALCLVAVLALGAYVVSSASALPEWGKCEAKVGGKYSDSNCTVKAKHGAGAYEWRKGEELKPVEFVGHNVGSGGVLSTRGLVCYGGTDNEEAVSKKACEENGGEVYEESGVTKIECGSEYDQGEITGSKEMKNITVRFQGCKLLGAIACSNGPNSGEIQVNPLKGMLGYISKSEKTVGVLLEPIAKNGEFAKFDCSVLETVVGVGGKTNAFYEGGHGGYDGIISPISPVNTSTSTYTQTYTINEATDENIPNKFEGKHIDLLEAMLYNPNYPDKSTMWESAGEEITATNEGCTRVTIVNTDPQEYACVAPETGEIKA